MFINTQKKGEGVIHGHLIKGCLYSSCFKNWIAASLAAPRNDGKFCHREHSVAIQKNPYFNFVWV